MSATTPMTREQRVEAIAYVCHTANAAWNERHGEPNFPWADVRESACDGVEGILRGNTPEQSHESWLRFKEQDGWTFGYVKDADAKTHPLMIPYDQLPEYQRVKDDLFSGIVKALAPALGL